jgi:hypothetical protein
MWRTAAVANPSAGRKKRLSFAEPLITPNTFVPLSADHSAVGSPHHHGCGPRTLTRDRPL